MQKEILEIIEKNLPAQMGDVLKQRLEQANVDAAEVVNLKRIVDQKTELILSQEKQIANYKAFDARNLELETREKTVDKIERNLEIEKLKYELNTEKEKTEFSKSVALGLVRNIEYRRGLSDSQTDHTAKDQFGNYCPRTTSQISTEITNAE